LPPPEAKPSPPKKPKKPKLYKFLPLPPGFAPVDATIDEVASFRKESRWTVFRKIREGVYESYRDGRVRKVIWASVLADRERAIAASQHPVTAKRKPGRPKSLPEEHAPTAVRAP
jgi:hypothetical protein